MKLVPAPNPIEDGPISLDTVIAQLREHRRTHLDWAEWLTAHPEDASAGTGDAAFQRRSVGHYDQMIAYLEVLREVVNPSHSKRAGG